MLFNEESSLAHSISSAASFSGFGSKVFSKYNAGQQDSPHVNAATISLRTRFLADFFFDKNK